MIPENSRKRNIEIFNEKMCVAPNLLHTQCSKDIIRSHSLQKAFEINGIQENNHVIGLYGRQNSSFKGVFVNDGRIKPEKVSSNTASTVYNFCSFHDREIWAPIERKDYLLNAHTAFLHGYRSVCREYYLKYRAHAIIKEQLKHSNHMRNSQCLHSLYEGLQSGCKLISRMKEIYDDIYLKSEFSEYQYYCITFSGKPIFQCNGSNYITRSPNGKIIQVESAFPAWHALINIATICMNGVTIYMFGFLKRDYSTFLPLFEYLETIKSESKVLLPIVCFVENAFFRISWWNSIDELIHSEIEQKFYYGALKDPFGRKEIMNPGYSEEDYKINSTLKSTGLDVTFNIIR